MSELTDAQILALAYRICTTYAHVERVKYGFTSAELLQFGHALIEAARATPASPPDQQEGA